MSSDLNGRRHSLALYLLCMGVLMVVLDTTIVTVALPSIVADLHLSGASLTWTLNAYTLTFGGSLLVSGRLGDLYGPRRVFLVGICVFTLASLSCGIAHTQTTLVAARAVQGLGGAAVTATSLSLVTNLFSAPGERARAIGIYGFVCAAGGGVGEVLGGFLSKSLTWHWIFLVNLPIGIAVCAACIVLLPRDIRAQGTRRLDILGAVVVTSALTLAVYAVINANSAGWTSIQTQGLIGVSAVLLLAFLGIEFHVPQPLMPLWLFRVRNFSVANVASVLWAAGVFAWYVIAALYLQRVLGYDPFSVGLAFVPTTGIIAAFSLGLSAKILIRFGVREPLWIGLLLCTAGLALFACAPLAGTFILDVLPGMLLVGFGGGLASTPLLLAAMNDVGKEESGLASGVLNSSSMMGGALGLAVLVSLADTRTGELLRSGTSAIAALSGGYRFAFLLGAVLTAAAAAVGALALRSLPPTNTAPSMSVSVGG